jgi:VCBS repeat protein
VLPDGRVIIEGGEYNSGCSSAWTNLGAIYDPVADTWTSVTPPTGWNNIGDAQSIVLADGTYLQSDCCHIAFQGGSPAAALLNATSLAWTSTGTGKADDYDEEGWTLLPNDNLLTVDAYTTGTCGTGTEQYTPGTGAWTTAGNTPAQLPDCSNPSSNPSYEMGPQVLRPDGTVVAFGGTLCGDNAPTTNCVNGTTTVTTPSAIFDSTHTTWSAGPDIPSVLTSGTMRNYTLADAPAVLEPNGNVLFAASPNYQGFVNPTHFFELSSGNSISQTADPTDAASFTSFQWNFLVLPTGQIMALETDGSNVWIYTPSGSPNTGWAPVVSSVPSSLTPGSTYQVSGSQLNGLSQGAAYGDDAQAATNFPIVAIQNFATGHLFYARSFGASTTSVAPNTTVTASFTVPASIEAGPSTLFVIANGISSAGVSVSVSGTGTFDLVFQNASFALWLWEMSGNQITTNGSLPLPSPNSGWQVVGTGDFDGDGHPDLVFQNNSSGALWLWEMNGTQIANSLPLPSPNSGWKVVAIGDFNGDGHPDLVFQNSGTGALWLWEMNATTIINSVPLPTPNSGWQVVGAADFNGDGHADDLVFQNNSTGALWLWEMSGAQIAGSLPLPTPNPGWNLRGVGTINGVGHPDLVFQNNGTGALWLWEMNGTAIAANGSLPLPTPSSGWSVRAM